jgi:soluble lytic murein transglycosylase
MAEAEFLAGFIALRKLNDAGAAALHFNALAAASPAMLTQSRASYWLGRTAVASGGNGRAQFARAAAWPMTFYGQLAARAAGEQDATLVGALRAAPASTSGLPDTPVVAELALAANQLVAWGDPRRARSFLSRMDELCRTPAERIAVGDYATAMGLPDIMVTVARRLGREGIAPPMQGWPVPVEPPPLPEPAVSLAIMRQESNFDVGIVSAAGARGLMQLMPGTARLVAHRLGEPTSEFLLTSDAGHNMRMGTAYLREVLEKFDNSVPLAAAAYNAGPRRVARWLLENGEPRVGNPTGGDPVAAYSFGGGNPRFGDRSMIDWIEMIPFNETRNYVQRVLENVVVYQARRTGTLPETMAQWSR